MKDWLYGIPLLLAAIPSAAPQPAAPDPVFVDVPDKPGLPRILLIGDSISMGYTLPVRKLLAGEANVHRIPENGGPTTNGIVNIDSWLGKGSWDVIHFNFGLHDLKMMEDGLTQVPLEQYEQNLDRLVRRLKPTGARLIWASTTPVPAGRLSVPRRSEDVPRYNAAAERVMKQHSVPINDLYRFALPLLTEIQKPVNVHFTDQGSERLAERVSAAVIDAVRNPKARDQDAFLTTDDGLRLHYLESGTGQAMLFVPGSSMPAEIWSRQMEHFGARHRVIAVDPRSQGYSSQTTEGNYPQRRARDLKVVIDGLHLAPVVLVAWSMSVRDTLAFVSEFGTESLRAVVLVDGRISRPDAEEADEIWSGLRRMQANRPVFTAQFVQSMFRTAQTPDYLSRITDLSLRTPTNTVFALSTNAVLTDWTPALERVDKPVLYVISSPTLRSDADLLMKKVSSARVSFIDGAGHALFVDQAQRFNQIVEEFLNERQ